MRIGIDSFVVERILKLAFLKGTVHGRQGVIITPLYIRDSLEKSICTLIQHLEESCTIGEEFII